MNEKITHLAFSDESNWNQGKYRSLGMVSVEALNLEYLQSVLQKDLDESRVSEFKWKYFDSAKERFAAERLCKTALSQLCKQKMRIDVLIWDIDDSRHSIKGRDDNANLQRMYYHLFNNVISNRFPNKSVWKLFPDQHTSLDWQNVKNYLQVKEVELTIDDDLFSHEKYRVFLKRKFKIDEIVPVVRIPSPLSQLADLFAGMAAFSHNYYDIFLRWRKTRDPQRPLFEIDQNDPTPLFTRSQHERFPVLHMFGGECKNKRLGVGLDSCKGLRTKDPKKPLNFWVYEPQNPKDKAPRIRKV